MYTEKGRWGGKLTSRPLPMTDPSIDRLADGERKAIADIWIGRAASERRVADAFEAIALALTAVGADTDLVRLATRAIDDEYRHTEISRVVASRFAGTELELPAPLPLRIPVHAGASEELRHTLHIVGHCTLNETTAGAFLETCVDHAKGALAKAACRELLSDEIDHARVGWAHLATVSPEIRAAAAPWMLPMVKGNIRMWLETLEPEGQSVALAHHGAPPPDALEASLLAATRQLVVPGLRALGMPTQAIDTWLAGRTRASRAADKTGATADGIA
jgi:hypothetical protein